MPGRVAIVRVGPEAAREVHAAMREAFAEYDGRLDPPTGALTETEDDVRRALEEGAAFLATLDGIVVGTARFRRREGYVYAERIGVTAAARGQGIGVAFMRAIEDAARAEGFAEVRLSVRASLWSNLRFYEGLGYRTIVSRPHPRGPDFEITLSRPTRSGSPTSPPRA